MNRDEQDWINALNATGNLANTLAKTEAQGLQTDAYLKEKADKERERGLADVFASGLASGKPYQELLKTTSIPGRQPEKKWWQSEAPKPVNIPVGTAEVQSGLNKAMERAVEMHKADFEMKKQKVAPMIRKLPMDKLNTLNFEEFGDMAEAARSVAVEDMKTRADASQYKMISDENIAKGIEQHWNGWSSSLGLANDAIAKGNKAAAMAKVATAINVHNGDSRKFEVNPETMTSGKFFIIQEGKKSYDDKEYQVEDLLKEMNGYTPEQFNEHNWKTAKASQIFNSDTTKNSKVFFNPNNGKYLTAQAQIHPVTSAMTWLVYDKGKPVHSGDISPILEAGYVGSDSKKEIDANIRSGLAIEGDREQIKTEKLRRSLINEQIKKAAAGGSDSGKINVNALKFFGKEFNKQVVSKMGGLGANIAEDDMGILKSGAPLDEKQKVVIENIGSSKGLVAALSPNESGGYNFHGFYTPDAAAEPGGGGKNYVNENMAKLTAKDGGEKKSSIGKGLIVPMDREPGAEKLAQGIKKTVERVDRAFSGDSGKSNQVKLDKLKKELVRHPNDDSLRNRISQLEKAMGK